MKQNPMPPEAVDRVNDIERADRHALYQYAANQPLLVDEMDDHHEVVEEPELELPEIPAVFGLASPGGVATGGGRRGRPLAAEDTLVDGPVEPAALPKLETTGDEVQMDLDEDSVDKNANQPDGGMGSLLEPDGRRRSRRINGAWVTVYSLHIQKYLARQRAERVVDLYVLHMQVREAVRKYGEKAQQSAEAELREMVYRGVFTPLPPMSFSKRKTKNIIRMFLFLKKNSTSMEF
jgi:hypothetical protein